nr:MFS transporter [Rickettsiaceae bacterium]
AAGTIILISMTIIMPISSAISDKIGRKKVLLIGATLVATCSYLVFYYIGKGNDTIALIACFWFSLIVGFYMGPVPTVLVELFPTRVRFPGVALSYNISAAIFGGTAPMVGTIFAQFTGDQFAMGYYLTVLACITLFSLIWFKETYKIALDR